MHFGPPYPVADDHPRFRTSFNHTHHGTATNTTPPGRMPRIMLHPEMTPFLCITARILRYHQELLLSEPEGAPSPKPEAFIRPPAVGCHQSRRLRAPEILARRVVRGVCMLISMFSKEELGLPTTRCDDDGKCGILHTSSPLSLPNKLRGRRAKGDQAGDDPPFLAPPGFTETRDLGWALRSRGQGVERVRPSRCTPRLDRPMDRMIAAFQHPSEAQIA